MANLQRKIWIDNIVISDTKIDAYTLIDDQDIDFSINKDDFQAWCDEHELRYWETMRYNPMTDDMDEDNGEQSWPEVYNDYTTMERLLQAYIQSLYDAENFDIESPIKAILSSTLKTA